MSNTHEAKEALDEARADPRSYLHFVTPDVMKYVLGPFVTPRTRRWFYENLGELHGPWRIWDPDGRLDIT